MISEKFTVRSISDVITNSSSEAFIWCNDETIESLKTLFNEIIQLVLPNDEQTKLKNGKLPEFDDYFDTEIGLFDRDWAEECFEDKKGRKPKDEQELWEWAVDHDECDSVGSRLTGRLIITPKNLRAAKVARLLEEVGDCYLLEVRY